LVLVGIFILSVVIVKSGRRSVHENVYAARWLLTVAGLVYLILRNRFVKHRTWRLLISIVFLAAGIALVLARNAGPASQRSYFELFYLLAGTLFIISLFKQGYSKWVEKKRI
jgi:sirohydrochlorin ferrochelatase